MKTAAAPGLAGFKAAPLPEPLRRAHRAAGLTDDALPAVLLQDTAARFAERPAVVDLTNGGADPVSYRELAGEVRRFAGHLAERGVRPGQTVLIQSPNCREALVASWAAWHLGCVLAPVVDIYREHELRQVVPLVAPAVVVTAAEHRDTRFPALLDEVLGDTEVVARVVLGGEHPGWTTWDEALATAEPAGAAAHIDPDAPSLVLFTSGTTSAPKAAVHSSRTLMAESRQLARAFAVTWRDRVHDPYPLAHIAGLEYATTISALTGSTALLSRMTGQQRAVDEIAEHGATYAAGPPGMVPLLAEAFAGADRVPLHTFVTGGTTVPRVLVEQGEEIGIGAVRVYGLTELPSVTAPIAGDPADVRLGTDGPLPPGGECHAVDPDTRARLPAGTEGELRVRGPERMLGYLDPEQTASQIDEAGWFYTGDLGFVDERGRLTVTGRIKDIINRGGEKFSARDIEDVLVGHPAVAEVAVVSAPDERYGEVPAAFVVAAYGHAPSGEMLAAFLTERGVAHQKTPQHWNVVARLPVTPFGKVKKFELQKMLAEPPNPTEKEARP
ncbi:MAG: class I adenylate-forming enzyme family protein [Solirubrobacteraceae bacterium]